jgi:exopolysaccharide production protein ExoZ
MEKGGTVADRPGHGVLLSIQFLRAVAALGVAASHVKLDLNTRLGMPEALPYLDLGTAGVDLFFVISGFVMVYASGKLFQSASGPRIFFVRRLIRIVPLYWACTTIYLAFPLFAPAIARTAYALDSVIASYLFIPYPRSDVDGMFPVVGQGWTLNYEMFFYVIFALAIILPRRHAVAAVTFAFAAMVFAGLLFTLPQPLAFWANPITLEFVLGCLLGLAYAEGARLGVAARITLIIAGLSLWSFLEARAPADSSTLITRGIPAAMILAGAVFGQPRRQATTIGRTLSLVGDASYALYLFHPVFIRALREVAMRSGMVSGTAHRLYLVIVVAIATVAAIGIHCAFERPVTQMLRRLGQNRAAHSPQTR